MAGATLKMIAEFFQFKSLTDFRNQWGTLSDSDKDQIKTGIGDGSLNY